MIKLLGTCRRGRSRSTFENADAIARMLPQLAGDDLNVVDLSVEEDASFAESLAQAERGAFATDQEMRAVWAKHGL